MTEKEYISLFREIWEWLSENPEKEKNDWPRWKINGGDVEMCISDCPLCEWVNITYGNLKDCKDKCPIIWNNDSFCHYTTGLFWKWTSVRNNEEKRRIAKEISNLPERI